MREISAQRVLPEIMPAQALGYEVSNAVAMLFDSVRRDGLDVTKVNVESIRVEQVDRTIRVTALINYPDDQRYACGCTGEPHWGPRGCLRA